MLVFLSANLEIKKKVDNTDSKSAYCGLEIFYIFLLYLW